MSRLEKAAGFLFPQYRRNVGLRFGSRLLDFYGRLFLGAPEQLGMDEVPAEHRETFYYLSEDRFAPQKEKSDETKRETYMHDNILINSIRHLGLKQVALTFGVMAMVACMGIASIGAGLHVGVDGVKRTASSLRQKVAPTDAEQQEMEQANGWTRARCAEALAPFYINRELTPQIDEAASNCRVYKGIEAEAKAVAGQQ